MSGRPRLWLRASAPRRILEAHLEAVAGRFAAAGWEVVRGAAPVAGVPVVVLDDPWLEPLPETAALLARCPAPFRPCWRVPRVSGLPGAQGWSAEAGPFTLRDYRRQARRARPQPARAVEGEAWCGMAAAPSAEAGPLLEQGWPPAPGTAALAEAARVFRYADPADHERREVDPFVPATARVIVDVGCGTGRLAGRLRRPDRTVVGVEPEWELAVQARRRVDLLLPLPAEAALLALRPGVDCFVFADVLEHLAAPVEVLRRAAAHLSPRGVVVVSLPNAGFAPVARALAAGRWDATVAGVQARDHILFTTPASFAELAAAAGLAVRSVTPLVARLGRGVRWWAKAAALLAGTRPHMTEAPQVITVLERR
jgi:2-polyprenyl-3-methyl-5-hydroxy-6-metoxy-1,4-benzoquinol methylase